MYFDAADDEINSNASLPTGTNNTMHPDSHVNQTRRALNSAHDLWSWQLSATWAYNRDTGLEAAKVRLRRFDARISRRLFGHRYHLRSPSRRIQFIAVPARAGYLHHHGVIYVPEGGLDSFVQSAPEVWRQVVPSGTLDLKMLEHGQATRWWDYALHNTGGRQLLDEFTLSLDFHSPLFRTISA